MMIVVSVSRHRTAISVFTTSSRSRPTQPNPVKFVVFEKLGFKIETQCKWVYNFGLFRGKETTVKGGKVWRWFCGSRYRRPSEVLWWQKVVDGGCGKKLWSGRCWKKGESETRVLSCEAQKHLLVVARAEGLDRLADVSQEHLPILKTMHDVGVKWARTFLEENKSLVFRLGYHSAPSMRQLHLHVISQDFDSKHLKNKKHWNSFNSPFFKDSVDVIQEIREEGKPTLNDDEKFMSMELRCNRCRSAHPNIPRLKSHITICKSPFPANLLQNDRLLQHAPNKDANAC